MSFSPDGKRIVIAGDDKLVKVWNAKPSKKRPRVDVVEQDDVTIVAIKVRERDGRKLTEFDGAPLRRDEGAFDQPRRHPHAVLIDSVRETRGLPYSKLKRTFDDTDAIRPDTSGGRGVSTTVPVKD